MENNTDPKNGEQVVVEPTNAGQVTEPVKTYTKEDIDNSFNAGVKKASSEWQKDEKYKEFLEWKKTNQSDSEKIANLELDKTNLTSKVASLEAQIKVSDSDVKKEFSKFVTSEVLNLVNDTTDFETALKNFKKDNPQYFGETIVKKVQSSPNLNGGGSQVQTTNSIMNDILRNARNN
jgi:hypothetical protein